MTTPPPSVGPHAAAPVPRKPPGKAWPLDYEGDFNVPALGLCLAVLFNGMLWSDPSEVSNPAAFWSMTVGFGVVIGVPSLLALWEQYRDIRFRRWILANWSNIATGDAWLDGVRVGPDTELVQYPVVFSALLVHTYFDSRPVLAGTPAATRTRWVSTVVTALAGWWSLRGLVLTPIVVTQNLANKPARARLADVANATLYGAPLHEGRADT